MRRFALACVALFSLVTSWGCCHGQPQSEQPQKQATIKIDQIEGPARTINLVTIQGEIEPQAAIEQLATMPSEMTVVVIDSVGGHLNASLAISEALSAREGRVICVVLGKAWSGAAIVFQACKQRVVTPESTVLMHDAQTDAPLMFEDMEEVYSFINLVNTINDRMPYWYCSRSSIPPNMCREIYDGREWTLSAEEALVLDFADMMAPSAEAVIEAALTQPD